MALARSPEEIKGEIALINKPTEHASITSSHSILKKTQLASASAAKSESKEATPPVTIAPLAEESLINFTKNFKIWFSADPNEFLPEINKERLKNYRTACPTHAISLVVSMSMLSEQAKKELREFCAAFRITALDIDADLPHLIAAQSDAEKVTLDRELLKITKLELFEFSKHKVKAYLAIASDVLRWSSCLLNLGNYSDLDTSIEEVFIKEIKEVDLATF